MKGKKGNYMVAYKYPVCSRLLLQKLICSNKSHTKSHRHIYELPKIAKKAINNIKHQTKIHKCRYNNTINQISLSYLADEKK